MAVDIHSHYFRYPNHFSDSFVSQLRRARNDVEVDLTVRWANILRVQLALPTQSFSAARPGSQDCGGLTVK